MKAIKIDGTGSVLIDTGKGFNVWMDVWMDGQDITADWNQYIFFLDNPEDVKIRKFQGDDNNFDICSSLAISYYEQHYKI